MQSHMGTIRKCSSVKSIPVWILLYFRMEYQISGVLGENSPNKRHFALQSAYLAKVTPAKTEMFTTGIADGSKEKLQKFLCGGQFLQCKNNRAGDENERRTTVDYKTRGAYEVD